MQINEAETSGTSFVPIVAWIKDHQKKLPAHQLLSCIILSDGGDNAVELLSKEQRSKQIAKLLSGIAVNSRSQVLTIGIGSSEGGKIPGILNKGQAVHAILQEQLLQQLALQSSGKFWNAQAFAPLILAHQVVAEIKEQLQAAVDTIKQRQLFAGRASEPIFDEYFQQPLLFAMLAMIASWAAPFYTFCWKRFTSFAALLFVLSLSLLSCSNGASVGIGMSKKNDELVIAKQLRYGNAAAVLGDFSAANSHYTALLQQQPQTPMQRALLLYNRSVIEIRQHLWQAGVSTIFQAFDALSLSEKPALLLLARLHANFAFVRISQAKISLSGADNKTMAYAEAALLYQGAKHSLEEAIAIQCTLAKQAGEQSCTIFEDYKGLHEDLKAIEKQLQSRYAKFMEGDESAAAPQKASAAPLLDLVKAILKAQADAAARHTLQSVLAAAEAKEAVQLKAMQRQAFDLERQFVPTAIRWQRQQYNDISTRGDCLRYPWDSIFAQAERGWQAGGAALELMEKNVDDMEALWRQWEAWQAWMRVYQVINENLEKQQSASLAQQQTASSTFEQALRNLEAMKKEEGLENAQGQIPEDSQW